MPKPSCWERGSLLGWARGPVSFGLGLRTACGELRSPPDSTQLGLTLPVPQWWGVGELMGGEEEEEKAGGRREEEEQPPLNEAPGPPAPPRVSAALPANPATRRHLKLEPTERRSPFFCR